MGTSVARPLPPVPVQAKPIRDPWPDILAMRREADFALAQGRPEPHFWG
jgi:hypothetical protein